MLFGINKAHTGVERCVPGLLYTAKGRYVTGCVIHQALSTIRRVRLLGHIFDHTKLTKHRFEIIQMSPDSEM